MRERDDQSLAIMIEWKVERSISVSTDDYLRSITVRSRV